MYRTDGVDANYNDVVTLLKDSEAVASEHTTTYLTVIFVNRKLRLPVALKEEITVPEYLQGKILFVKEGFGFVNEICT